jgi:hypothetical protein
MIIHPYRLITTLAMMLVSFSVAAQEPSVTTPNMVQAIEPPAMTAAIDGSDPNQMESLFFTNNQLISIARANQGFIAPTEAYDPNNQTDDPQDSSSRIVSLQGIVYNSPSDWTIWLNGARVTPDKVPERAMDLSVAKDRIRLRWMDIANQRIVNFTLRPNQTYLLDSDTIIVGVDQ